MNSDVMQQGAVLTTGDVMQQQGAVLTTGDVIELPHGDDAVSVLVLLAAEEFVILDLCDGSMPFVLRRDELVTYRKFEPAA